MVEFGQTSIADDSLRGQRSAALGVHILRLNDLYRRSAALSVGQTARYRVPVHLVALVTSGRASFTVDFSEFPCRPGGLLWVRPGQFVSFPPPGVDATLILFEPEFPYAAGRARYAIAGPTSPNWSAHGTYWQPVGEDEEAIVDGVSQLEIDYKRILSRDDIPESVLRHSLAALLLRLDRLAPEGADCRPTADSELLQRFRQEVDARHAQTRQVEEYAKLLGCSVRTLTRASLAATGRTAKQLVDDRVALEAKRLLAEASLPVAEIGAQLGFGEATNFGRFFARMTGRSPGQFRAESHHASMSAQATTPPAKPLAAALAKAGTGRVAD